MATVTSLGFNVFSRYDGGGLRRARRDLAHFASTQRVISGHMRSMTANIAAFGPIAAVAFTTAAAAASRAAVAIGAAGAGLALWGLAMKNAVKGSARGEAAMKRLKSAMNSFGSASKGVLLDTFEHGVRAAIKAMRALEPVVAAVAPVMHKISKELENFAGGPHMKRFAQWLSVQAPAAINALWVATKNLGSGLLTLGQRLGVFDTSGFNKWLVRTTESFKRWANGPEIPKLNAFLNRAGPLVGQLASSFLSLAKAVFVALAPMGLLLIEALIPVVKWLTKMAQENPIVIQTIWGIILANRVLNAVMLIYRSAIVQVIIMVGRWIGALILATAKLIAHSIAVLVVAAAHSTAGTAIGLFLLKLKLMTATLLRNTAIMIRNGVVAAAHAVRIKVAQLATTLWTLAQNLLTASMLRNTAAMIRNGVVAAVHAVRIKAVQLATTLWTLAQNLLTASMLRTTVTMIAHGVALAAHKVRVVAIRLATVLWVAVQNLLNASFLRTTATMIAHGAILVVHRTRVVLIRAVTLLWVAVQNLLNASFLRTTATMIAHGAVLVAHRTRVVLTRAVTLLWVAVQNLLNASFLRTTATMIAHGVVMAAHRVRVVAIRAITLLWVAVQNLLNATFLRTTATMIAHGVVMAAHRVRVVAIRAVTLLWVAVQNLLNATFLRTTATMIAHGAVLVANRIRVAAIRAATLLWVAAQNLLRLSVLTSTASLVAQRIALIATRAAMLVARGATIAWVAAQRLLRLSTLASTASMVAQRIGIIATRAAMLIARVATLAWAAAQAALNAVMLLNPFVLIATLIIALVAAIVIAYNESETFRNIVQAAFNAVRAAAMFMWDGIQIAFNFIRDIVSSVGSFIVSYWTFVWNAVRSIFSSAWSALRAGFSAMSSGIQSAWSFIRDVSVSLWNGMWQIIRNVFRASWNFISSLFSTMMSGIQNAWEFIRSVSVSLWNGMWQIIQNILSGAWSFISSVFSTMMRWIQNAWEFIRSVSTSIWNSMWNGIRSIFITAWSWLQARFNQLRNFIGSVFNAIQNIATSVWDSMWQSIGNIFVTAWTWIVDRFTNLKNFIVSTFEATMNAAKNIWNTLKSIVATPINFVIGVYNDHLFALADKVLNAVGVSNPLPKIPKIPGFDRGGVVDSSGPGFAAGGVLKGYSPGKDNMIGRGPAGPVGLSGGEGILRPEVMRAPGMTSFLHAANQQAIIGGKSAVKNMLEPTPVKDMVFPPFLDKNPPRSLGTGGNPPLGFAKGGMVGGVPVAEKHDIGDIVGGAVSAARAFIPGVNTAISGFEFAKENIWDKGFKWIVKNAMPWFSGLQGFLSDKFHLGGDIAGGVGKTVMDSVIQWIVGQTQPPQMGNLSGMNWEQVSARLKKGLKWAKSQDGKPYQWGGNGNPSWDCSSYLSAIESVIYGEQPHRRWTTHPFHGGAKNVQGWEKDLTSPFMIGVTGAGVGHTAGTLIGTNVESSGSGGVQVGSGARGADHPMFDHIYGLKAVTKDAVLASGGGAGGSIPEGDRGRIIREAMKAAGVSGQNWLRGMNTLIKRESNWDAGAVNNWDSNAAAGQASRGLAQVIPPTFNAHKVSGMGNIMNPVHNVAAAIRYIQARYGGIGNVQQADPNASPRGYFRGGHMNPGELALVGERGPEVYRAGGSGGQVYTSGTDVTSHGDTHIHFEDKVFVKNERDFEKMVVTAVEEARRKKKF